MTSAPFNALARSADQQYRALLDVSEAMTSPRDLPALFHELAGRLQQGVRFDYFALLLHKAAGNTLRLHVLEPPEHASAAGHLCKPQAEPVLLT
jgi:hypothetical protein